MSDVNILQDKQLIDSKSEKRAINCDIQHVDISDKIQRYRTYNLKIDNIYEQYNIKGMNLNEAEKSMQKLVSKWKIKDDYNENPD